MRDLTSAVSGRPPISPPSVLLIPEIGRVIYGQMMLKGHRGLKAVAEDK